MRLADVTNPELVWPDLRSASKAELLQELAQLISASQHSIDVSSMSDLLFACEELASTALEDGVAIPHSKVPGLQSTVLALGRSQQGVDFEASDMKPTKLFFVLLVPEKSTHEHLSMLARLSRLMKISKLRSSLLKANTAQQMYDFLIAADERISLC